MKAQHKRAVLKNGEPIWNESKTPKPLQMRMGIRAHGRRHLTYTCTCRSTQLSESIEGIASAAQIVFSTFVWSCATWCLIVMKNCEWWTNTVNMYLLQSNNIKCSTTTELAIRHATQHINATTRKTAKTQQRELLKPSIGRQHVRPWADIHQCINPQVHRSTNAHSLFLFEDVRGTMVGI